MQSDMALSKIIEKSLYEILTEDRISFIDSISQAILANKLVEKRSLVNFFSRACNLFTLASNSTKAFIQVGGNFAFVILVLSFNTFNGATYVGDLSENDQKIISQFEILYRDHQYQFKFSNSAYCSCLNDNVYCIFDACKLRGSIESYIECCEVYLSKKLTENFKTFSILRHIYLNKKCFLISMISLKEIPNFNYFNELPDTKSSSELSQEIIGTFPRKKCRNIRCISNY